MRVNWDNVRKIVDIIFEEIMDDLKFHSDPTPELKKIINVAARGQSESKREAIESLVAVQIVAISLRAAALALETRTQGHIHEPHQDN